jgi:hypothetical protein
LSRRVTRRSQSVVPFGVGAIVEFEDEALMAAGLDAWPEFIAPKLFDDRLARRLRVQHFLTPPPRPDKGTAVATAALPFVRFPQWHFCPRCRWLERADLFALSPPRCGNPRPRLRGKPPCGTLPEKRRWRMLPLRFVVACRHGHIDDFPWNEWVHSEPGKGLEWGAGCQPPQLYFFATKMAGLGGLLVECSECGRRRSLLGSTSPKGIGGLSCRGKRPWLGNEGAEACRGIIGADSSSNLLAVQRGASNIYFPHVASSILIPPFSSRVAQVLQEPRVRQLLESEVENKEATLAIVAKLRDVDVNQLRSAYASSRTGGSVDDSGSEVAFRYAEYQALHLPRRDAQDLLICRPQPIGAYGAPVRAHFSHVTLVERLAETRALTGAPAVASCV